MKIKEIRKAAGLSQSDIAKLLKITTTEFVEIEEGFKEPSISQLIQLADKFGVNIDTILGHKSTAILSQGEAVWLNIRKSLPEDKLETLAQMINGVNNLQLSEMDIKNICDTSKDMLNNDFETQISRLFKPIDDSNELTFDDYLILFKINSGEKIAIDFNDDNSIKTKYSFTHEGKFYSSTMVAKILNRLNDKFQLLAFEIMFYPTKKGAEWGDSYPKLNKRAKALLKEKETEFKK